MSDFTYQQGDTCTNLENYEWDNVWWEHAATLNVPRVLYIGDSISCATRRVATHIAENKIFFDGFGTSKALDNPYFTDALRIFAKQQGERKVILFNNGLHGWHLEDTTDYEREYEKMLRFLLKEFEGTPLILLLTTHVANTERDQRVQARNQVAKKLAKKYVLPVVDLYTVTKCNLDLLGSDGVHFTKEGYTLIAEALVNEVKAYVQM